MNHTHTLQPESDSVRVGPESGPQVVAVTANTLTVRRPNVGPREADSGWREVDDWHRLHPEGDC